MTKDELISLAQGKLKGKVKYKADGELWVKTEDGWKHLGYIKEKDDNKWSYRDTTNRIVGNHLNSREAATRCFLVLIGEAAAPRK
jgi:hypothetical protein